MHVREKSRPQVFVIFMQNGIDSTNKVAIAHKLYGIQQELENKFHYICKNTKYYGIKLLYHTPC